MRRSRSSALSVAALIAAACGQSSSGDVDAGPSQQSAGHSSAGSSWTVMVYMLADNNLEEAAYTDLLEMMELEPSASFNVVALVDRAAPGVQGDFAGPVGGIPDWTTGKYLRVKLGALEEVQDLGETDMGDPATLAAFIEWAAKAAPADRYALVLWDHGGAWPRFGVDEGNGGSGLDLSHLKKGLADGMKRSGIQQFGIIGFDACLMSTLETALAMRSYGEYLVASEEVEPGHGWDYQSFSAAQRNPGINALDLAKALVSGFYAQAQQQRDADAVTLAVTDLYALDPLVSAVASLGGALSQKPAVAGKAREAALQFGDNPDPAQATNQVDLGDLAARLAAADSSLAAPAKGVADALGRAVLAKQNGSSKARATGLSVFFPANTAYYRQSYDELSDSGAWRSYLKSFLGQGESIDNKPQFVDDRQQPTHDAQLDYSGADLVIQGTLAAGTFANVVGVSVDYGIVDQANDALFMLGARPGSLDAAGVASASWDVTVLKVAQGTSSDYGYLSLGSADGGNALAQIPLAYTPPGAQGADIVILAVVMDSSGNELARAFYSQINGAWSELSPEENSRVQTLLRQVTLSSGAEQWTTVGSTAFDPRQPLNLSLDSLGSPGSGAAVFEILSATDYGGNSDYVIGTGTL